MEEKKFEGTLRWLGTPLNPADSASYERVTEVRFATGSYHASAATSYGGDDALPNPETLMIASLMQCHFLTFMAIAHKRGYAVRSYADRAEGLLGAGDDKKMRMLSVHLHPEVQFVDPAHAEHLPMLHQRSHANCFMANSVNFPVTVAGAAH